MSLSLSSFLIYFIASYFISTFVAKESFLAKASLKESTVSNVELENFKEFPSVINDEILLPVIEKTLLTIPILVFKLNYLECLSTTIASA